MLDPFCSVALFTPKLALPSASWVFLVSTSPVLSSSLRRRFSSVLADALASTPTEKPLLELSAALKFTSPPAATCALLPAAKSVPTKVALPPAATVKLLPALMLPVTACEDREFSTPKPKEPSTLLVSVLVCLLASWFSSSSLSVPIPTLTDNELEEDSFLASLNVMSPPAANCASPPASMLAPSSVMLRPAEMFKEPPVLMFETTASELLSLAFSTPTFRFAALLSLSKPADTLTDNELASNVFRAASILTSPPAATLVSPATLI